MVSKLWISMDWVSKQALISANTDPVFGWIAMARPRDVSNAYRAAARWRFSQTLWKPFALDSSKKLFFFWVYRICIL